ncbi:hypothetical protein [Photorhabdus australis]|nr:hypothetical protein [Photorhabdus australis]
MAIIRLKINVRYEQQEVITVDSVLMDLFCVTQQILGLLPLITEV